MLPEGGQLLVHVKEVLENVAEIARQIADTGGGRAGGAQVAEAVDGRVEERDRRGGGRRSGVGTLWLHGWGFGKGGGCCCLSLFFLKYSCKLFVRLE